MKEYMITSNINDVNGEWVETYTLHKRVGGLAYIGILSGSKNELAGYIKANGITNYGYGF